MNKIRVEKFQVFLLGLMLGLLIGLGFFIFKLDNYFGELDLYKNFSAYIANREEEENRIKKFREKSSNRKKPEEVSQQERIQDKDSLADESNSGSIPEDTVSDMSFPPEERNIVVKRDELISVRNYDINLLDPEIYSMNDSLLSRLTGIQEEPKGRIYKVEYWVSPLNYKGYKMSKNKIILYGLNSEEPIQLFKIENKVFLRLASDVYRLNYSDHFRQFEKETDDDILARISK